MAGSSLERVARRVPGFAGYSDRTERRASDRALRDFATARIERVQCDLEVAIKHMGPQEAAELRAVIDDLDETVQELRCADRDYAGFLSASSWSRVDVLGDLYARDEQIVETLVVLSVAIEEGNFTATHVAREVRHLQRTVSERCSTILVLTQGAMIAQTGL
jgi:hypothetical protein